MKKLLFLALILGLVGSFGVSKVQAAGFYSSRSTAIAITVGSDMELCTVEVSSGSVIFGDSYLVGYDTDTVYLPASSNFSSMTPVNLQGDILGGGNARWPATQMIFPPLVLLSSFTSVSQGESYRKFDFEDSRGECRDIGNSLVIMKLGVDYGTVYTLKVRKRRDRR